MRETDNNGGDPVAAMEFRRQDLIAWIKRDLEVRRETKAWQTVAQVAAIWELSAERVRQLCKAQRVLGAWKAGRDWMVPLGAARPLDGRAGKREAGKKGGRPKKAVAV